VDYLAAGAVSSSRLRRLLDSSGLTVWLTAAGQEALRRDRDVLSVGLLADAMTRMPPAAVEALIEGLLTLTASKGEPDDL
jgi:hypothetical protein